MPPFEEPIARKLPVRGMVAMFIGAAAAACVAFALVLTTTQSGHANARTQSVRAHGAIRAADLSTPRPRYVSGPAVAQSRVPSTAKVLAVVGGEAIYQWHVRRGEPRLSSPGSMRATEDEICVGTEGSGGGGGSCGSAARMERRGSVQFSGSDGASSPVTITAVVPNGVNSIEVIERGGATHSVAVSNNVAVYVVPHGEEGLPAKRATVVSYKLPSGEVVRSTAPPPSERP